VYGLPPAAAGARALLRGDELQIEIKLVLDRLHDPHVHVNAAGANRGRSVVAREA